MTHSSETGIDVNVANFGKLIFTATGFGAAYNPSNKAITIEALNAQAARVNSQVDASNEAATFHQKATNNRDTDFSLLNERVTQINNSVAACGASKRTIKSVHSMVNKIRGQRTSPKMTDAEKAALPEGEKAPKQKSSSHLGFPNRVSNLGKLISILENEPCYTPNEEVLKVSTLKAFYTTLKDHNDLVANTLVSANKARKDRNAEFSNQGSGMLNLAAITKKYIKSVYNAKSPEYKSVSGLKFTPVK